MKGLGKLGTLFLVIVLCTAALGIGYAAWQDTLTISGTVETGEVCVGFTDGWSDDPCVAECDPGVLHPIQPDPEVAGYDGMLDPSGPKPGPGEPPPRYNKNVAGCWVELDVWKCEHDTTPAYQVAYIMLCNGYPSYWNTAFLEIANCGTVPVKPVSIIVTPDVGEPVEFISCEPQDIDLDGDGANDVTLHFTHIGLGPTGPQIDPCQTHVMDLEMHVLQNDENENGEFYFSVEMLFEQWNTVQ